MSTELGTYRIATNGYKYRVERYLKKEGSRATWYPLSENISLGDAEEFLAKLIQDNHIANQPWELVEGTEVKL